MTMFKQLTLDDGMLGETNSAISSARHPEWRFARNTLPWLRGRANAIVNGPDGISVERDDDNRFFEKSLQVVERVANERVTSWTLFERFEDHDEDNASDVALIGRICVWDTRVDLARRAWETESEPTVSAMTALLECVGGEIISEECKAVDSAIQAGTPLIHRVGAVVAWKELSVFRGSEWGIFSLNWHASMETAALERAAQSLAGALERVVKREVEKGTKRPEGIVLVFPESPYLA